MDEPKARIITNVPILIDYAFTYFAPPIMINVVKKKNITKEIKDKIIQSLEFQFENNPGFSPSLLSTMKHFPISSLHQQFENIGKMKKKILTIWGVHDEVVPYNNAETVVKLTNSEFLKIDDAEHQALQTHFD